MSVLPETPRRTPINPIYLTRVQRHFRKVSPKIIKDFMDQIDRGVHDGKSDEELLDIVRGRLSKSLAKIVKVYGGKSEEATVLVDKD